MRKNYRFQILDYVPPIVAFLAAVAAIIGSPKWSPDASGFSKITPFGWVVLAIGFLALITSMLVTSRNKREQATRKKTKERIAAIGIRQLLREFQHTIHPIANDSIWCRQCDAPESPLDLLDPNRRKILASLDLNSASPYGDGSFEEIRWFSMLERAAREGVDEITTTLQIYASYLSPEIMDVTTKLLYSDFLRFRLMHIREIVVANTHRDANRPVPFFCVADDEMHNQDYEEFWHLLAQAMNLCGAEATLQGEPRFTWR
ncbi:hypothetical protein [Rhodanobacter terrae]|uniref:Phage abortive infection protein n=1 Tax=Rhodanobacter terrae TaxID=418647 RepID=A0ABW0SX97_9GAMM